MIIKLKTFSTPTTYGKNLNSKILEYPPPGGGRFQSILAMVYRLGMWCSEEIVKTTRLKILEEVKIKEGERATDGKHDRDVAGFS